MSITNNTPSTVNQSAGQIAFLWDISPAECERSSIVCSPKFEVKLTDKSTIEEWSLQLNYNMPQKKQVRFSLKTTGSFKKIPETVLKSQFEVVYGRRRGPKSTLFVNSDCLELSKCKDEILYFPLDISIDGLTNNFKTSFYVRFTYGTLQPDHAKFRCLDAFSFAWSNNDPREWPMQKTSSTFEITDETGIAYEAHYQLDTNNDHMQIGLIVTNDKIDFISKFIRYASIELHFKNQEILYEIHRFKSVSNVLKFSSLKERFSAATNNYKDPFDIIVHVNKDWLLKSPTPIQKTIIPTTLGQTPIKCKYFKGFSFKWNNISPLARPTIKNSTEFQIKDICGGVYNAQCQLSNINDCVSIRLAVLNRKFKLNENNIGAASIQLRYKNHEFVYKNTNFTVNGNGLTFKRLPELFSTITNNYKDPFEITLHVNQAPPTPIPKTIISTTLEPTSIKSQYFDGFSFKWSNICPSLEPTVKKSSEFQIRDKIGEVYNAQCQLSNNDDYVSIRFEVYKKKFKLNENFIDTACIELRYKNHEFVYKNAKFIFSENGLTFKRLPELYSTITNNYQHPFEIILHVNENCALAPMNTIPPAIGITKPYVFPSNPQSMAVLSQLNDLLVKQESCDVSFDCDGTLIGAHRNILSCQSKFFRKLLVSDKSVYKLDQIQPDVLADVLQYIYTGCAPNMKNTAERLIMAAKAFDMPELKDATEITLINDLGALRKKAKIDRMLDLFELDDLRPTVLKFIVEHLDRLMDDEVFEQVVKNRPDVFFELFRALNRYDSDTNTNDVSN